METWQPNPDVLALIELELKKQSNWSLLIGKRILTKEDLLQEIKSGTKVGRRFYEAFMKSSLMQKR